MQPNLGVRQPRRRVRSRAIILFLTVLAFLVGFNAIKSLAQRRPIATISIDISHPVNRFTPSHALGAGIDGHEKGTNDLQLTRENINAMLAAGFKSLTYRLRTELGGDVWHWNPNGSWSDPQTHQGYWTSASMPGKQISLSYGYRLPRRGNTVDQAENNGYSRIDDGDTQTFWKSNPYLDSHFSGEENSLHPQWVVIEFGKAVPINALRIVWGRPFAKAYRVQYGNFDDVSDIALNPPGTWTDFPHSEFRAPSNAVPPTDRPVKLSDAAIKTHWIRILLTESSGTGAASSDVRDRVGFAIRELYAGTVDEKGDFHDQIDHAARHDQTIIHVSSTDPWHRASDQDDGVEQVGLDRVYRTGLTNDLPMLLPTGLLFDTPENAANEIQYLRRRGYKFDRVELGEEPDGQYVTPEDFGALYLQFAEAIHRIDPQVQLGGPSFQEVLPDLSGRLYRTDNSEWMRYFLTYLNRRGHAADYSFFSFEWYPFDDVCDPPAPQLARAPRMLEGAMREMERHGVSRKLPWIISEYGYSAFGARTEISIEGALLNAEIIGKFLALGGEQAFLFGYTPDVVLGEKDCTSGNNMLFSMDDEGKIKYRFATYFGARLVTHEWLQPGDQVHEMYRAGSDIKDANGNEVITAYAVHRPDGLWSLLLINKDPKRSFDAQLLSRNDPGKGNSLIKTPIDLYQYSEEQYLLGGPANNPYPVRAEDPVHKVVESLSEITLPPYSLTVLRGAPSR
jgi:F5/8 type C domain-containing protein